MIHELPKRLELHGVSQDHLRGSSRTLLRNLTGVRIARDLRATFQLNRRTYEVAFGAGVDPNTGLIWLDGSRVVGIQLYEGDDATPEPQPAADSNGEVAAARAERGHGISDADRAPTVPSPSSFRPLSTPRSRSGLSKAELGPRGPGTVRPSVTFVAP